MIILNVLLVLGGLVLCVVALYWMFFVISEALSWALLLLPLIVALGGIIAGVYLWQAGHDNMGILVSLGAFGGAWWLSNIDFHKPHKCPKCGSKNTETYDTKTETYSTTNMEARRITHFNNDGDEKGYSEYDVEVPSTGKLYYFYHRCKACSHKWIWHNSKVIEIDSKAS